MNYQYIPTLTPLRVMVINPLSSSSQLTISKMLSGIVFGMNQLLDLILLVYSNELDDANLYVQELISSAFPCFNSIRATSDLPSITDADVFCCITNFQNPNTLDYDIMNTNDMFDSLYLILKIAISLGKPLPQPEVPVKVSRKKAKNAKPEAVISPIIVCDGLVAMDILYSLSENLPSDIFFCSTPLESLTKTVLSDYLKVECHQINHVHAWGANDLVFHVEICRPYLKDDKVGIESKGVCDWDAVGDERLDQLGLDHTQFNASFMKKEFIEKIVASSEKNPYGFIYTAAKMSKTMRLVWKSRYNEGIHKTSLGVISDGSLETIKGIPYYLPLIFEKDKWIIDISYSEKCHVKSEIKRINVVAKEQHEKLISYCKRFLKQHVIDKEFVPVMDVTPSETSEYSSLASNSLDLRIQI